jgi:hypothetical protein
MKSCRGSLFLLLITLVMQGCYKTPILSEAHWERISVGPGPEDMILDSLHGDPRLIISCSSRREGEESYGEIVSLDLTTGKLVELTRHNETGEVLFRPHGIYLDGEILHVISHESEPDDHPIMRYRVHADHLEFLESIRTSSQHSPNALVTGPDGEIYFVNDSGKRGSLAEKIFRLKRASLVCLTKGSDGKWSPESIAVNLGYPAGINRIGDKLYVGDAILHRIHVFRISRNGITRMSEITGPRGNDNIRIYQGKLLVPGHVKPFRFIQHARNASNLSPVEVTLVDPRNGQNHPVFYTDGTAISGGSTALIHDNHLYISQVFDPYILKVELEKQDSGRERQAYW